MNDDEWWMMNDEWWMMNDDEWWWMMNNDEWWMMLNDEWRNDIAMMMGKELLQRWTHTLPLQKGKKQINCSWKFKKLTVINFATSFSGLIFKFIYFV